MRRLVAQCRRVTFNRDHGESLACPEVDRPEHTIPGQGTGLKRPVGRLGDETHHTVGQDIPHPSISRPDDVLIDLEVLARQDDLGHLRRGEITLRLHSRGLNDHGRSVGSASLIHLQLLFEERVDAPPLRMLLEAFSTPGQELLGEGNEQDVRLTIEPQLIENGLSHNDHPSSRQTRIENLGTIRDSLEPMQEYNKIHAFCQ